MGATAGAGRVACVDFARRLSFDALTACALFGAAGARCAAACAGSRGIDAGTVVIRIGPAMLPAGERCTGYGSGRDRFVSGLGSGA